MNSHQKWQLLRIITILIMFLSFYICNLLIKIDNLYSSIIYFGIFMLIGYDIIINAIRNIFNKQFLDENFLMLIASIGAFIIGEYPEAVAVMLFYQIGEYFQDYAVNKSRKSIAELMDIAPQYANLVKNGEILEVYPDEVNVGDIIIVRPGEKVPLDGVIIRGSSELDTKALTGESLLKAVNIGDEALSGMINTTNQIEIKVTKHYSDSTVQKILELVENASSVKSKSEKFISKFAKYYTPIVVLIASLLAIIPSLITKDIETWVFRALNFLVVSCPCALVISVPLSFFIGIGKASKMGLLIKGSIFIEEIEQAKVFVFDKTGTITKGTFEISEIITKVGVKKEEILAFAAIAEQNSNHPIAKSIKEVKKIDYQSQYLITELPGRGIIAESAEKVILCGNEKLLLDSNIAIDNIEKTGTMLHIAVNNEYLGTIIIKDTIKIEAKELIEYLNMKGYEAIVLSGDNELIVSEVCEELGIKKYYSELLPVEKVQKIDEIMKKNINTCYIGDGINDAPVLMRANIGISMGLNGSDAAIESSDIVIMDDNIKSIKKLIELSSFIMKIVKQNIIFAISIKLLILILSSIGVANMWMAIFADVGVSILAILNAFRINMRDKYE